jgi:hypothetical protein
MERKHFHVSIVSPSRGAPSRAYSPGRRYVIPHTHIPTKNRSQEWFAMSGAIVAGGVLLNYATSKPDGRAAGRHANSSRPCIVHCAQLPTNFEKICSFDTVTEFLTGMELGETQRDVLDHLQKMTDAEKILLIEICEACAGVTKLLIEDDEFCGPPFKYCELLLSADDTLTILQTLSET